MAGRVTGNPKSTTIRPFTGLREFLTTITSGVNALPATSPHGSNYHHYREIFVFIYHPIGARGTLTAHPRVF